MVEDEIEISVAELSSMDRNSLREILLQIDPGRGYKSAKGMSKEQLLKAVLEAVAEDEVWNDTAPEDNIPDQYWRERIQVSSSEGGGGEVIMDKHAWEFFDIVLQIAENSSSLSAAHQKFSRNLRAMMKEVGE